MINWLSSLPNFTAYGTPVYFIYLLLALLPLGIALYFGKRFQWYEALISFIFIFLMFDGASWQQLFSLIAYVIYQTILVILRGIVFASCLSCQPLLLDQAILTGVSLRITKRRLNVPIISSLLKRGSITYSLVSFTSLSSLTSLVNVSIRTSNKRPWAIDYFRGTCSG